MLIRTYGSLSKNPYVRIKIQPHDLALNMSLTMPFFSNRSLKQKFHHPLRDKQLY